MTTSLFVRGNTQLSQYDEERIKSILELITEPLKKKIKHDLLILFKYGPEWKRSWEKSQNLKHKNSILMVFMTSELSIDSDFRDELSSFINLRPKSIVWIEYQNYKKSLLTNLPLPQGIIALNWTKQRFLPLENDLFVIPIEKIGSTILELMSKNRSSTTNNRSSTTNMSPPKIIFAEHRNSHLARKKPDHKAVKKHLGPLASDFLSIPTKSKGSRSILAKPSPNVITMFSDGTGDYPTLVEAVSRCPDNGTIIIKPGIYLENLIISRPINIIGEGNNEDIEIRASGSCNFLIDNDCVLRNLTIRQFGGIDWYAIDVRGPYNIEIDKCNIQSDCNACIAVHSEADPYIHHCFIHDSADGSGIFVYDRGRGRIEHNKISWNKHAGIEIKSGAEPIIRFNHINDSYGGGILVYGVSGGLVEENEIIGSAFAGIQIEEFSNPTIRKNLILAGKQSGIYIRDNGEGVVEDNDISSNEFAGIAVESGGSPFAYLNRIHFNNYGIWVYNGGKGTYEGNDLQGNKSGSWLLNGNRPINSINNAEDK
ncbi:right-handed parallel beta-helix repeat-containing protein [Candidatus Ichthyocystis sparus]|uniref:right-handed parallel beta-helix repeat-containing protein n=2 Tax=Candidatus Ichthyocystis TaxID=2929841 RepID=UPI000B865E78|nr:right-handed parallel beta-helix repeat-containing protein [Candidatus Ichthyocystis sparus]